MNSRESFSTLLELRRAFQAEDPEEVAFPLAKLVLNMYGYDVVEPTHEDIVNGKYNMFYIGAHNIIYNALLALEDYADNYEEKHRSKRNELEKFETAKLKSWNEYMQQKEETK